MDVSRNNIIKNNLQNYLSTSNSQNTNEKSNIIWNYEKYEKQKELISLFKEITRKRLRDEEIDNRKRSEFIIRFKKLTDNNKQEKVSFEIDYINDKMSESEESVAYTSSINSHLNINDQLVKIFNEFYFKYNRAINIIDDNIEKSTNYNLDDILNVLNTDRRFINIYGEDYGLIKWIFDRLDKYFEDNRLIEFKKIEEIAKEVNGVSSISRTRLREYFSINWYHYDKTDLNKIRKRYPELFGNVEMSGKSNIKECLSNKTTENKIVKYDNRLENKGILVDKLVEYFEKFYYKNRRAIVIKNDIADELGENIDIIMEVLKSDKRFYQLSGKTFGLIKWVFNEIDVYIKKSEGIYFSQIKASAIKAFGSKTVNIKNLEAIFKWDTIDRSFSGKQINNIRDKYLLELIEENIHNKNIKGKTLADGKFSNNLNIFSIDQNKGNTDTSENILSNNTNILAKNDEIDISKDTKKTSIKDISDLKEFGLIHGYVFYEDIDKVDISEMYGGIPELILDFISMGIKLLDK